METIAGHLYDFPKYYDVIFGSDWAAEFKFLEACFRLYMRKPVRRVFEPGCGTGRMLLRLGKAGYEISGLDLNPKAIAYCNDRLKRNGLPAAGFVGDMANFQVKKKADAAFNLINTFRHLPDEKAARAHFRCMADAVNKGGLYILGLHLTPKTAQRCLEECWSASRGSLTVNSRLWSKDIDLKKRVERIGMTYDVHTPTKQFRIEDETTFRTYSAEQIRAAITSDPRWEIIETYDFRYDMEWPIEINSDTEDVMYVIRRK